MAGLFPWLDLAPDTLNQSILPGWSFMTVNEGNSSAPGTEQRIVAGDSYGRQIGRMMDVMAFMLNGTPTDDPAFAKALTDFKDMKAKIDEIKLDAQKARQDRLIEDLLALKRRNETQFNAIIQAVTL